MHPYIGSEVGIQGTHDPFSLSDFKLKFLLMSNNSSIVPLSLTNSENGDNDNVNQDITVSDTSKSPNPHPVGGSRSNHPCN